MDEQRKRGSGSREGEKTWLFPLHQTSETTEFRLGESAYPYMYAITAEFTVGEEVCMN